MSVIGPRPLTQDAFSCYSKEVQRLISMNHPGLSGIGAIVFRDEENILTEKEDSQDFYSKIISPYKGKLESWYVKNYGIKTIDKSLTNVSTLSPLLSSKTLSPFLKTCNL